LILSSAAVPRLSGGRPVRAPCYGRRANLLNPLAHFPVGTKTSTRLSETGCSDYYGLFMFPEFLKLTVGLALMLFHRPIADYILEHERSLVIIFRQRGVPVPAAPTTETGRNIYFCIGGFIVMFQIVHIWMMLNL
jgi:hypothetical protein